MKRRFPGLHQATQAAEVADGLYLVRVQRAQYRWHAQKPFYGFQFAVVEPKAFAGRNISGRLYCTDKALWKLSWFLRDFGYDAELLGHDELAGCGKIDSQHGFLSIFHLSRCLTA